VVFRFFTPWGSPVLGGSPAGYFLGPAPSIKSGGRRWAWPVAVCVLARGAPYPCLLSYQGPNDLYTAVQKGGSRGTAADNDEVRNSGIHGFLDVDHHFQHSGRRSMSVRFMADIYLNPALHHLPGVSGLTAHISTDDWLDGRALLSRPVHRQTQLTNPDQPYPARHRHFSPPNAGWVPRTFRPTGPEAPLFVRGGQRRVASVISFRPRFCGNLSGNLRRFRHQFSGVRCSGRFWSTWLIATVVAIWLGPSR